MANHTIYIRNDDEHKYQAIKGTITDVVARAVNEEYNRLNAPTVKMIPMTDLMPVGHVDGKTLYLRSLKSL